MSTAADDELLKNKSEEANQKQLETELEKLTGEPAVKENNIKRLIDKPYEFAEDIEEIKNITANILSKE